MTRQMPTRLDRDDLNALYQYAIVLCQDESQAQDLLQSGVESYLVECQKNTRISEVRHFIRRVIRNRFIDTYRQQQRWSLARYEEEAAYDISPMDLEQATVDQQALERAWSSLAAEDRDILYHWAVLGYSTDEACQLLDIPRGTFLSRIHRLRKKLQQNERLKTTGGAQ